MLRATVWLSTILLACLVAMAATACGAAPAIVGGLASLACNVVVPFAVDTPSGRDLAGAACEGAADLLRDVTAEVIREATQATPKGAARLSVGADPAGLTFAPVACRGANVGSVRAELRRDVQRKLDAHKECQR